jgi:uncharacterized protein YjbI with pentapeptide repeats
VIFHFYVLLNLMLLARTAQSFDSALAKVFPRGDPANEAFRMRIENKLFVQLLVGARPERLGFNSRLISALALITLAVAPVVLILFIQARFLPYHSEGITWIHRGLLFLDLCLIGALWAAYRSGWGVRLFPASISGWASFVVFGLAALLYAGAIANFPDEKLYRQTFWLRLEANAPGPFGQSSRPWYVSIPGYVVIWPANTLDLHNEDLVPDSKLRDAEARESRARGKFEPTLRLNGRNLIGADFSGADIRNVDFTGANLTRADLSLAWATKARFDCVGNLLEGCARLEGASLAGAQLQGASFHGAQLQRASLVRAQLQGASLDAANLNGAALDRAELEGASFYQAMLPGATFREANLQGASFDHAALEAATFDGAKLQGATLKDARLQSATFIKAELQGAVLDGALLACAALPEARLEGASFDGAQLQGASLDRARVAGASFAGAFVWRADARAAVWPQTPNVRLEDVRTTKLFRCRAGGNCPWTADRTAALKEEIKALVPSERGPEINKPTPLDLTPGIFGGDPREEALQRIAARIEPDRFEEEAAVTQNWEEHIRAPFSRSDHEKAVAEARRDVAAAWRDAGCEARGAPYVVRGLAKRLQNNQSVAASIDRGFGAAQGESRLGQDSSEKAWLAREFLATDSCPGARGLSDDEIKSLRAIAEQSSQQR